jgi:hypothetical protein
MDEEDMLLKVLRCDIGLAITVDMYPKAVKTRKDIENAQSVGVLLLRMWLGIKEEMMGRDRLTSIQVQLYQQAPPSLSELKG